MSSEEFRRRYCDMKDEVHELRDLDAGELRVWHVNYMGVGDVVVVNTCVDFINIASVGSILITYRHGAYLKIERGYWVRVESGVVRSLRNDLDIFDLLVIESDRVTTLITTSE